MVKRTCVDLKAGVTGGNVAVSVPLVDRGRSYPRNILGVIVNRNLDTDQYAIAVKAGILNGSYFRNQFDLCPPQLLTLDDVDQENQVSLRTAVTAQSCSGGQLDKGISNVIVVEQTGVRQIDVNALKQR